MNGSHLFYYADVCVRIHAHISMYAYVSCEKMCILFLLLFSSQNKYVLILEYKI